MKRFSTRISVGLVLTLSVGSFLSCKGGPSRPGFGEKGSEDGTGNPNANPPTGTGNTPRDLNLPPDLNLDVSGSISGKRVWRLTYNQYVNSVDSLLGTDTNIRSMFDAESIPSSGFGHEAEGLKVGGTFASKLEYAVYKTVEEGRPSLEERLPCEKFEAIDQACLEAFIADFGTGAFRRPLSEEEKNRYREIYAKLIEGKLSKAEAVSAVAEAILRSPYALFRTELGESGKSGEQSLTPFELAQALSFALTNAPPDPELHAAAADGTLMDDKVYIAHAKRLLGSPGFERAFADYVLRWTGVEWLKGLGKSPELFPEYSPAVSEAMIQEVRDFARATVESGMSFDYFMTSHKTTVSAPLAPIYNLPAFTETKTIEDTEGQRSGIITLPGVMAMHSTENGTSPMHRAVFLMGKVSCAPPGDPPDNLVPSETPDPNAPIRTRFKQHVGEGSCRGCHITMDPYGFSLEHYDPIGRFRTMDGPHPVDASGTLSDAGGEFKNGVEMLDGLRKNKAIQACFVANVFRYVNGRNVADADKKLIDNAQENFVKAKMDMTAVFLTLVTADSFKTRKDGE